MRKRLLAAAVCATLPVLAPPATAARGDLLAGADGNGDGAVSEQEWMSEAKARFDTLDTDHNGTLDQAERQKARDSLRERFRSRREQRRSGGATTTP